MPTKIVQYFVGLLEKLANKEVSTGKASVIMIGFLMLIMMYPTYKIYENERQIREIEEELSEAYAYKLDSIIARTTYLIDSAQKAEADKKANFSLIRENEVRRLIEQTRIKIEADKAYIIVMHNSGGELTAHTEKHFSIRFEQPENLPEEQMLKTYFTDRILTRGLRSALEDLMLKGSMHVRNVYTYPPFIEDKNILKYLKYFGTKAMAGVLIGRDPKNLSVFFLAAAWREDTLSTQEGMLKEFHMMPAANSIRERFELAPINPRELQRGLNGNGP